ncbi:hypothetical protein [Nonomuraea fuscirosea]|uniref:hypothetical protein n=1 Tax=Nonomuraea fuscirosea TaxID=1291556 RepID=UPI003431E9F5
MSFGTGGGGAPSRVPSDLDARRGSAHRLGFDSGVLSLNESFAGLDVRTRERLQETLARVRQHTGTTIAFVTRERKVGAHHG